MKTKATTAPATLRKSRTGIRGLDEITGGGLPAGRPTLVCGGAGCGKTLLALEFLVRGITEYDEPGVFMAFEETGEELADNVASLGFDLKALVTRKKLLLDYVYVDRSEYHKAATRRAGYGQRRPLTTPMNSVLAAVCGVEKATSRLPHCYGLGNSSNFHSPGQLRKRRPELCPAFSVYRQRSFECRCPAPRSRVGPA